MVPPDYYVPIDSRSTKPGLFKSRVDGNSVCPNMYSSLTEEQRKRAQETAIAGVHISESDRVKGWDPTDIIRLLPTPHKLSDSLLSNFLVNKIFLMIEEEAVKQGKRVHTCNMDVLQRMTEPSIEVFLKCQYDQLYSDILDSEVILCPSLHADHWCLVVVYPAIKRMVYLDSLFRGIGARRAFQRVGNFIACAMKLKGQKYGIDEWDFFIIPTNDIEQQLSSVDCGVFVVKWAQHIAEGRMIDFKQRHINDFRYSLILDIAENKLSCLSNPFPSNEGSNSCEQTANSNANSFTSSTPGNGNTILHDHSYSLDIQDNIPEQTSADVLPQHVQCILPPTAVYKCLEYEELPKDYCTESNKYRVKFNIKNLSTPKEIERWVSEFSASSNIKYNSQGGYKRKGVRVSFAQWYICECKRKELSKNLKEAKSEALKRRQKRHGTHAANSKVTDEIHLLSNIRDKKKTDCESKMAIKVRTKAVEQNVCEVELWWNHNHSVNCHHLTTLSQILPSTRHKFITYFEQGMSASGSFHHHETTLMKDPVTVLLLADRKYRPSLRDVNNLWEKWRKTTKGPCNGSEMFDFLQEYITTYNKDKMHDGGKIFLQRYNSDEKQEKPLIISICTPMMSRVHKLRQAGKMAFMDASGSLDRHNNPVYFMCTHHPSGALPLAVWITSSQSEATLKSCLHNVVSVLPQHAFGGEGVASGPSIFLTDDDSDQRNALRAYWRSSVLLLCIFHFLQAVWRWLLDRTNSINKDDRQHLMSLCHGLVFADTVEKFNANETMMQSDKTVLKYPTFCVYIKNALERKEQWALCFRKGLLTRGNNTDNFTESMIFVFKCVILKRIRAYNLLELVKFITEDLEMYFQRKLLALAFGKPQNLHVTARCFGRDASTVALDNITKGNENSFHFNVTSRTNKSLTYQVDTSLGTCTCPKGENGSGCAHEAAVALKYGGGNINFIPRSAQDRYALAVLAIGDNPQLNVRQFVQLHEKSESVINVENESENEIETVPQRIIEKDVKEDEQQRHDTVLGHREEEPVALKEILKLHHEVAADIELKIRNEDNNFKKCYYNFLRTYRNSYQMPWPVTCSITCKRICSFWKATKQQPNSSIT